MAKSECNLTLEQEDLDDEFDDFLKKTKENFEKMDFERQHSSIDKNKKISYNERKLSDKNLGTAATIGSNDAKYSSDEETDDAFLTFIDEMKQSVPSLSNSKQHSSIDKNKKDCSETKLSDKNLHTAAKIGSNDAKNSSDEETDDAFQTFIAEMKQSVPSLSNSKYHTTAEKKQVHTKRKHSKENLNVECKAEYNDVNDSSDEETDAWFLKFISEAKQNLLKVENSPSNSRSPLKSHNATNIVSKEEIKKVVQRKENIASLTEVSIKLLNIENEATKNFMKSRIPISQQLYHFFNKDVFNNRLPEDMSVKWNSYLRSTAGYCHQTRKGNSYSCKIELSTSLLTSFDRLRDTLLHEMCHAACWIVNKSDTNHGPLWKTWAGRCHMILPEVEISAVCHDYEIAYKLNYRCTKCEWKRGRFRKFQNLERKRCPRCRSPIVLS